MRLSPIEITLPRLHQENIHAITLWPFIVYRRGFENDIALRCHEYFHWRQAFRWGVLPWYIAYLLLQIHYFRLPADQHPLEAPAYAEQREVLRLLNAGESVDGHLSELGVRV
jgi:hypothetical protein